ncbi:hypothetical protein GCM10009540_86770 [Streptomyces turgidiscabies]
MEFPEVATECHACVLPDPEAGGSAVVVLRPARADRVQVEEFYQAPLTTPRTGGPPGQPRQPVGEPRTAAHHTDQDRLSVVASTFVPMAHGVPHREGDPCTGKETY